MGWVCGLSKTVFLVSASKRKVVFFNEMGEEWEKYVRTGGKIRSSVFITMIKIL